MDDARGQVPAIFEQAGLCDALVAALDSDSPHCVAAAVATLRYTKRFPKGRQALRKAEIAIRALVRLIENSPLSDEPEKDSGANERCVYFRTQSK